MAQDLRDLLKQANERTHRMKPGHEQRFTERLDQAMAQKSRKPYTAFMIAASLLLLLGFGGYVYLSVYGEKAIPTTVVNQATEETGSKVLSLGDLSPDLRKVEQYYMAQINLELSGLEVSDENKAMVDSFMERLGILNKEYEALNNELNTIGPNDQTINALINNLQLRLELLYKLKDKLDTLKSLEHETEFSQRI